jgi:hypothetical protein
MAEYAKDAAETETPWERWGYRDKSGFLQMSLFKHPEWRIDFSYHRKPRTISINGHEVPEPMRVKPGFGDFYYWPRIGAIQAYNDTWTDHEIDHTRLSQNICFSTREAAEAASLAIASLFKP